MEKRRSIVGAMIDDHAVKGGVVVKAVAKAEMRSKRLNLLVRPSVYDRVKKKCDQEGISVNEAVNQLLEQWTEN